MEARYLRLDLCYKEGMGHPLPWSDHFAVGHPLLDAQHRRLVELINDVCAAVLSATNPDRLAPLIELLHLSAREHFRQEDAVMWEIKMGTYEPMKGRSRPSRLVEAMAEAAFDDHIAEHATMLTRFDAIVETSADTLCEALKAWFVDHVIMQDAHLKSIFQAM
jgi:hemerythrin